MTYKEIQDLVRLISKSNLTEFKLKDGEFELSVRTNKHRGKQGQREAAAQPSIIQMPNVPPAAFQMNTAAPAPSTPPMPVSPTAEASPAPAASAPASAEEDTSNYIEVKAPIVGTFYRSSSPEKPAFVKVGDTIEVGQVVCIIEAMKLFNEIEAEVSGKVVKVMIEDAHPVEYDQVLFLVDPKG